MERIKIGQIVNVVGLKGELKIYSYAEDPSRFEKISCLYVEEDPYAIEQVRYKGNLPIVKLEGISDRNAAEAVKNKDVFMDEAELPPLPKGECYIKDILGFDVVTTQGETLGQLQNVIKETAQSLYVVETPEGKKIYIPGVPAFILEKNLETKKITVNLPEGLLDL